MMDQYGAYWSLNGMTLNGMTLNRAFLLIIPAVLAVLYLLALWLDDPHLSRSRTGRRRDAPSWLPGCAPRAA